MKEKMNILVVSNDKYIKYLYVLMESLYKNHVGTIIYLYVLTSDIKEETRKEFEKWVRSQEQKVEFCIIDAKSFEKFKATTEQWPVEVYYRLFPHKYLPQEEDRVLYLDVDIIVNGNIMEFYKTDFQNQALVACGHDEFFEGIRYPNEFTDRRAAENTVFNSGVILFNLNFFRANVHDNYYNSILEKGYVIKFPDQGVLNYYFYKNAIYKNTLLYNFRWHTWLGCKTYKMGGSCSPKIIHYTCKNQPYKPWDLFFDDKEILQYSIDDFIDGDFYININLNSIIGIWWKYAICTPVYPMLFYEMSVKKEWIKRFGIFKKINAQNHEIKKMLKALSDKEMDCCDQNN